jgi:Carboxypeptidase regulatory-like domain
MRSLCIRAVYYLVFLLAIVVSTAPLYAQSGANNTTLSGVVVDAQGGVIPGADVTAKNNATALILQAVTDGEGRFVIPSVLPGTYTVRVALQGFKTAVAPDVQVLSATPASVKLTLELGNVEESVVVTGASDIVQTQSATVATTIAVKQIQQLPVISHTALDFVVSLPGIETNGLNFRGSTINGLPTTSINITLDGINAQDKRGSEGMFMYIRPMMDSVEEVTVSTSNAGAEATGAGGANIKMETRSGSNKFSGSVYDTWRNQAGTTASDALTRKNHPGWLWKLNTPYWFDKRDHAKTAAGDDFLQDVRLTTPGFRIGGPIAKDKLFYFFNYEEFRLPQSVSRTRYILSAGAQAGLFTYPAADGSGNKTIDLLALAASRGQTSALDPTIAKLLGDIRKATGTDGSVTPYDQLVDQYNFSPSSTQLRKFPTLRMDYNLTPAHHLTVSTRYNSFDSTPDFLNSAEARFPGFPNFAGQSSGRYMWQGTLRSTLAKTLVNEFRVGVADALGRGTYFGKGVTESMFNCQDFGCQSANGVGYNLNFPSMSVALTSATGYGGQSAGVAGQRSVEETVTWLRGVHSLSFGGSFAQTSMRNFASTPYPMSLSFGTQSNDATAFSMLDPTSGNFPGGINSTWAGYARSLYGFLTGRVTNITSTYYLQPDGSYIANGERTNGTIANDVGLFASDSWRLKPNFTVTLGVRYQAQLPMTTDGLYSRPETWQMVYGVTGAGSGQYGSGNLFKPGVLAGTAPIVVPYENNRSAYNTDWNNVAPSVGAAWRPTLKSGFLSKVLSTDPVIRGGYSLTYTKLGTDFFDSNYSGNPGRSRAGTRTSTSGTPLLGYDGWPVLLRDGSRIYPSGAPSVLTGDWALTPAINETLDIHYPDWPAPATHQYSLGLQRELGKATAIDIRYVGNINVGGWATQTITDSRNWSMLKGENGFYDEFRTAQANLRANIIAGKGNTFAYTGAPGTAPLPIFMAYLQGIPLNDARNQDPTKYTASQFSNSSWYNALSMYSPNIANASGSSGIAGWGTSGLQNGIGTGTGFDANRIAAGLPINFFEANPAVAQGNAYLETTAGNTRFNAMQVEVRRRLAQGFLLQGNYQHSFDRQTWMQRSLREDWFYVPSTGGPDHSAKFNFAYELPFGSGRKLGSGAGKTVDRLIGGWEVDGVGRVQSGAKFNYGGFRLVGVTEKELQKLFKFYHVPDATGVERLYMFPQDFIQNSILALYTASATTATGYAGALPTGAYLAPASGPDCVQYYAGQCPGTSTARILTGPKFWKVDLSVVKRIPVYKNVRLEARMDVFNLFNTINFSATGPSSVTSTTGMGASLSNWQVTSAAQDVNNSQDPGGRMSQFGLRITW